MKPDPRHLCKKCDCIIDYSGAIKSSNNIGSLCYAVNTCPNCGADYFAAFDGNGEIREYDLISPGVVDLLKTLGLIKE